jgi:hypothetical protein
MKLRYFPIFPIQIGVFLATAYGFCNEDLDDQISVLESEINQIRTDTPFGTYGAKTASAAPQIDGYEFFITADFLWWKLYEGGTEYALKDELNFDENHIKGPVKHLNFEWEPGYKVGIGTLFDYDSWNLFLNFTSFTTHAHNSAFSKHDSLIPLIGIQTLTFAKARAHWKVDFRNLDFVLGRDYFVSKYLALHPFFGIDSAWIHQHRKLHFEHPSTLKLKGKNNFWGIGPKLGTESQFYLGRNFSIYGDIAGALLWGKFEVDEKEDNLSNETEYYDFESHTHRMVATIGFGLGVAFETNFCHDHYHFLIKAGYESQYWWKQNQFPIFDDSARKFTRQSEDLSMQGLTAHLRLDF